MKVQWKKLELLADAIEKSRKYKFDMWRFRDVEPTETNLKCGTVACALGHGPGTAGLEPTKRCFANNNSLDEFDWYSYSADVFGIRETPNLWRWLFSGDWTDTDNTRKGAIQRLRWTAKHRRVPKDWAEQMLGLAPLCYKTGAKK